MNKTKLLDYLSHKTWLWKRVFCNFYITRNHLDNLRIKTDPEPEIFVRCCQNVDDLSEIWNLAEYIDFHEEEIISIIEDLRFCRPIPWQYDFVQKISEQSKHPIPQTLSLDAIADAYCTGLLSAKIDLPSLLESLDAAYTQTYHSVSQKQDLLKRNFSLILETSFASRRYATTAGLNYRELVDLYLPSCGIQEMARILKQAQTPDIKITPEERACQAFAYYSPYFCDEVDIAYGKMPQSSLFACVEERLHEEKERLKCLHDALQKVNDEDEEDEIRDALEIKHNAVFIDPQERCLLDVWYGDTVYANVYVQKFPQDYMNNSLTDFIRYHKGCLYTVEFVDDISELETAQEYLRRLNAIKSEMLKLEKTVIQNPHLALRPDVQVKLHQLNCAYASCFYISL